jgi:hypothetical protein
VKKLMNTRQAERRTGSHSSNFAKPPFAHQNFNLLSDQSPKRNTYVVSGRSTKLRNNLHITLRVLEGWRLLTRSSRPSDQSPKHHTYVVSGRLIKHRDNLHTAIHAVSKPLE